MGNPSRWRVPLLSDFANSAQELRTVLYTPTGKDRRLIANMLERSGIGCHVCGSFPEVCRSIDEGAGAIIVAEKAFAVESLAPLHEALQRQPSWSDFPVILLTSGGRGTAGSERLRKLRRPLGNIFLLERRPLRPETLLGTLEIALRGRQRQYQIRDQIRQYALAQQALLRSEKLAVTGRLAASIAHEINNPLEAITNLIYLMRSNPTPEQLQILLAEAEQELARVTEITKQTLRFYRETSQPVETDVASVLDSVLKLYGNRVAVSSVSIEREVRTGRARVLSTPGELRQVLANLIGNAIDAMRGGGRLRIRISEQSSPWHHHGSIRISVADTGTGIAPDVFPAIFEPFVTTKGETGTGLGLWVTSEIIRKSGWRIRVRSSRRSGRSGTVFSIQIPKLGELSIPSANAIPA